MIFDWLFKKKEEPIKRVYQCRHEITFVFSRLKDKNQSIQKGERIFGNAFETEGVNWKDFTDEERIFMEERYKEAEWFKRPCTCMAKTQEK